MSAVITIHAISYQASQGRLLTESDGRGGGRTAFDKVYRSNSGRN